MKKTLLGIVGVMMISGLSASAAFTPPTDEQLTAAANDPATLAALLVGASPEQEAQVVKAVIVQLEALGLPAATQGARVSAVVAAAFADTPAASMSLLAASLGTACGASVAISANPAVVSSVQSAVITAGGASGAVLARTFGEAYTEAKAANQAGNNDALSSAPPQAKGYAGQQQHLPE